MAQFPVNTPTFHGIEPVATLTLLATAIQTFVGTLTAGSYSNLQVETVAFITSADAKSYGAMISYNLGTLPA